MKKTRFLLRIAVITTIAVTIMIPGSNIGTNNIRCVLGTQDCTVYENYEKTLLHDPNGITSELLRGILNNETDNDIDTYLPCYECVNENINQMDSKSLQNTPDFSSGNILVKFKSDVDLSTSPKALEQIRKITDDDSSFATVAHATPLFSQKMFDHDEVVKKMSGLDRWVTINFEKNDIDILSEVARYQNHPLVEYAEPDYRVSTFFTPNDPLFDQQWVLHNTGQTGGTYDADIDAPEAWNIEQGSEDVIIAIIDTGIDWTHTDLANKIWINDDEIEGNGIDDDDNGVIDDKYGANFVNEDIDFYGEPPDYSEYKLWKDEAELWHFRFKEDHSGDPRSSSGTRYYGNITTEGSFQNIATVNLDSYEYTITDDRISFDAVHFSDEAGFDFQTTNVFITFDVFTENVYSEYISPGFIVIGENMSELQSPFTFPLIFSPFDDYGHGTHCAGIIAAETNNGQYIEEGEIVTSFPSPGPEPGGLYVEFGNKLWITDASTDLVYILNSSDTYETFSPEINGFTFDGQYFWYSDPSTDKIYKIIESRFKFEVTKQYLAGVRIAEFEIYDSEGEQNFALLGTAEGSGIRPASNAIDGDMNTFWETLLTPAYFDVELPWAYDISRVVLKAHVWWGVPVDYTIQIWEDDHWETVITEIGNYEEEVEYILDPSYEPQLADFSSPGPEPRGLAWDGDCLWVVDSSTDRIYKLNSDDGSILTSFAAPGPEPRGLAWDGEYLFVSDSLNDRIYKVSPGITIGGMSGVCPNSMVMAVKFLDSGGNGYISHAIPAIMYAVDNGAKILCNSWGGGEYSQALQDTINAATEAGALFIAAAGNSDSEYTAYPAAYDHVLSVAATDYNDQKASYSTYGTWIDMAAPGGGRIDTCINCDSSCCRFPKDIAVISTTSDATIWNCWGRQCGFTNGGEEFLGLSGTSTACAHVAGVAGLLFSQHPEWGPEMVYGQLKYSTDAIDDINPTYEGKLGTGRLNAYNALTVVAYPVLMIKSFSFDEPVYPNTNTNVLVVDILNEWAEANDVHINLISTDPDIQIIQGSSSLGTIGPGEIKNNSAMPFVIQIGDVPYCSEHGLTLELTYESENGDSYDAIEHFSFGIDPLRHLIAEDLGSSTYFDQEPAIGDIDGDGKNEIVLTTNVTSLGKNRIYALSVVDDEIEPLWFVDIDKPYISAPVVLADLDDDGALEIVVGTFDYDNEVSGGSIHILNGDGTYFRDWPLNNTLSVGRIVVGDMDGSGEKKIVVASSGGAPFTKIFNLNKEVIATMSPGGAPAIADLDDDGDLEIVAASYNRYQGYKIFNHLGQLLTTLDVQGRTFSTPAIGDIDDDGEVEIVVSSYYESGVPCIWSGATYAFETNGQLVSGNWPVVTPCYIYASPALYDADGDGDLEIFVSGTGDGRVYAFDYEGNILWTYQTFGGLWGSPALGDVDDDGICEIVVHDSRNYLHLINAENGNPIAGWPRSIGIDSLYYGDVCTSPVIGDLEHDGFVEIVTIDVHAKLNLFSCGRNNTRLEWPMFHHDAQHTGLYSYTLLRADAHGPYYGVINEPVEFIGLATGGSPPYTYHWDFGDGNVSTGQNTANVYSAADTYTVTLTVIDNADPPNEATDTTTATITDSEPPAVTITKPENALYIKNAKIRPYLIRDPFIIGKIDIEVDSLHSGSNINKVNFYIDNKLKYTDYAKPYNWTWDEKTLLKFRHTIKVIAYDTSGNKGSDEMTVWKFF